MIANGTVIVFVQGELGVSILDSLIRPIVVHRIVDTVVQGDGTVCYRTKGDNNQLSDPTLVKMDHVLGVETLIIPRVGILVLFFQSPFGLVLLVGLITMFYVGKIDIFMNEEKRKETFLSVLAGMVQKGELPREEFNNIEFAVRHPDSAQVSGSSDSFVPKLLDWIKRESLRDKWTASKINCSSCSKDAIGLKGKKKTFVLCPYCAADTTTKRQNHLLRPLEAHQTEINRNSSGIVKSAVQEEPAEASQSKIDVLDTEREKNKEKNNKDKESKKSFFLFGEREFDGCHYKSGYLKSLRKNAPIPDECFGCPKILECLATDNRARAHTIQSYR
jgi:hypothetical protein